MDQIRVLLVDDHAPFRAGLRALLATSADIEVCGEAASGEEALAVSGRLQPDVVLLDLTMPGMGGIAATERLVRMSPHVRVLILSMADDDDSVFAALRAGARGYVLKGARRQEIIRSVRVVADGEAIFGPAIATRLMGYFAGLARNEPAFPELTAREREILTLIAQHLTNPQIAARFGLSTKTVRNHVSNIFAKLQVADRAQAISMAREQGL
ncbi:response regulator transcription factor [Micromonospora fiedleri]|uniref:Response regulator transcription factor n=2 Tax=Micromonospora TaxID=1873 RepID=A0ABS1UPH5_9ACTN|nr:MULTISPECIES: response regulator transcription factor [Micromonospora]MBL6278253.1 response regulator transcription factor [Micromonospora fiedleri]PMR63065.1 DNA-binding response regulator [Verrucosispora sp. ts21]RUL94681.1 DNA-binding response regulator [Verrucosispora sp. FIM060022]GIJ18821.1 DNA-binding response regulator [Micromonospora gifhornensis]